MNKVKIEIENLKCMGCASTIKKRLLKLKPVESVIVDVDNSEVEILFEGEKSNVESFKKSLSSMGYPEVGNNNTVSVVKSYVSCAIGKIGK